MPPKIALLIDAENVSYKDLPEILEEVPRHGQVILSAVYGDWNQPSLQKWYQLAEANNFKIRHQPNGAKIKNSSDIKLMLDAMEVLLWTPAEVFCLVTNDADYVPLCYKLRESNKSIMGIGYPHAAEAFIRACDQFVFIGRESLTTPKPPVKAAKPSPKPAAPPFEPVDLIPAQDLLSQAFARVQTDKDGWVGLSMLGLMLQKIQPNFRPGNYGRASLFKLLQTMPDVVEVRTHKHSKSARLIQNHPVEPPEPQPMQSNLLELLAQGFAIVACDAEGWVDLSELGSALPQLQQGFQPRLYGHSNLTKLLKSLPDFVELRAVGSVKFARMKTKDYD